MAATKLDLDVSEDLRWHGMPVHVTKVLAGQKNGVLTKAGIWVSPAMWDLIENAGDLAELRFILAHIPLLDMRQYEYPNMGMYQTVPLYTVTSTVAK